MKTNRILSLSGGGYLGLYTAKVLEELEMESGKPINESFALIAGTSVGGIIALALANGCPAVSIREAFQELGPTVFNSKRPPQTRIGNAIEILQSLFQPRYSSSSLEKIIVELVGTSSKMGQLRNRVVVPAVNLSTGRPCVFKTPHHPNFTRDLHLSLLDVALATSAAPTYFPAHRIGGELFADGGIFANSPDEIALIEAEFYLDFPKETIKVLSIGTPTKNTSISNRTSINMGVFSWLSQQRLSSIMLATQQLNTMSILRKRLGDRYLRIEESIPSAMESELSLDCASQIAQNDLLALAEASIRVNMPKIVGGGFIEKSTKDAIR